jgi:hypothetical protein
MASLLASNTNVPADLQVGGNLNDSSTAPSLRKGPVARIYVRATPAAPVPPWVFLAERVARR